MLCLEFCFYLIIKGEVGAPMPYDELARIGFRRLQRVVDEFRREEYQAVETLVEEATEQFAQTAFRLHDGLVVPHDDGLAKQAECAQQHNEFETFVVGGVDGVETLAAGEHTPRRIERSLQSGEFVMRRTVIHHIDAVVGKVARSVEEMRRELALRHATEAILYVLRMVEINLHNM